MYSDNPSLLSRFLRSSGLMPKSPDQEHVIDTMIRERTAIFSLPIVSYFARLILEPLLNYKDAIRVIDAMNEKTIAADAMQTICDEVPVDLTVTGLENVPAKGAAIMVSNHPTGICDGLILYNLIKQIRQNFMLIANRDVIRSVPVMADLIVPVEWKDSEKTREKSRSTAAIIIKAMHAGRMLLVFPSGRVAARNFDKTLAERKWNTTAYRLARKYNIPIVPVHIIGRNSNRFYFLSSISTELRDVSIFAEVMNKKNAKFEVHIGPPINPFDLNENLDAGTKELEKYVVSGLQPELLPTSESSAVAATNE